MDATVEREMTAGPRRNYRVVALIMAIVIGLSSAAMFWDRIVPVAGLAMNYFRSMSAPPGTATTESNPDN